MIPVALSSWSLHTLFLNPETSGLHGRDFPRVAREHFGVRHIEFYEGDYAPDLMERGFRDEDRAMEVRRECEAHGVSVVCLAGVNDLTADKDEARARDRERILRLSRHCEILRCPVIRINSGRRPLDSDRVARLVRELLRLSEQFEDKGRRACLAIENHPHVITSDAETDRLIEVVERVDRKNVRLCPDVGAMGPGFWRRSLEKLAKWAVHVHLKPMVQDDPQHGVATTLPVADYGPQVRELLEHSGYSGAVAYENLPVHDLGSDHFEATLAGLRAVADAFGTPLQPTRPLPPAASPRPTRRANEDKELAPPKTILQLLADGCELRLNRQVRILDLARQEVVYSQSAAHREEPDTDKLPGSSHFCSLVDRDRDAARLCTAFYEEKKILFRKSETAQPRVCLCPMGLLVLSVPIADESNVYGAITCGPWVEQGTEGLIVDGIIRHVGTPKLRPQLDDASLRIDSYSPGDLLATRKVVENLARDLAGLYEERHLTRRYLEEGSKIIRKLQEASLVATTPDPESFLEEKLEKFSRDFEVVAGFGRIALYRRMPPRAGHPEILRLQSAKLTAGGSLPTKIGLPGSAEENPSILVRAGLLVQLRARTRFDVLEADRHESDVFVVFCYPQGKPLSGNLRSLFNQFATEVHYVLDNLHALKEAETRREELVLFTNRFKHAISSALQGISDRVLRLRRHFEGKRHIPLDRFHEIVRDLTDFSVEAESVQNRFTGLVRITGHEGSLRPQYSFATINVANILAESVRRWSRAADRRGIRIKGPDPGSPLHQEGDRNALSEVFDNLVENAQKFAKDGTVVEATVTTVDPIDAHPEMSPPWPLALPGRRFLVRDRGLGIAPEDLEGRGIFKPFVQGRAYSPSRVIKGTGVGLAICEEIVRAHGGTIVIQSRPASGAEHRTSADDLQDCIVDVVVDLPMNVPKSKLAPPKGGP